ncbi:MAG: CBS domain-containing protein [Myxococcota bacterium]|jgi:CBS domain-containing protein
MPSAQEHMSVRVDAFMAKRLYTVRPDSHIYDVVQQLVKRGFSGCPVVEGSKLVGVLSEKDCIRALIRAVHDQLPPQRVSDVMTSDVITVSPSTPLLSAAHLFLQHPFRRLPVVESGGRLLGQVSRRDLLKHAIQIFKVSGDRKAAFLYLSAVDGTIPPM